MQGFNGAGRQGISRFMKRRTLLAALLAPTLAHAQVPSTPQDQADIGRAEAYLNTIHTLKARFQQIAPNGSVSGGTAWLQRPGRMRFQYDAPAPFLLVAGHGLLVFNDSQLEQTSNLPLDRTPLGLLLRDNLKLSGDITVTRIVRYPGQLQLTVTRTASPADGSLTLIFADKPARAAVLDRCGCPAAGDAGKPIRHPARRNVRSIDVHVHRSQVFRQQFAMTTPGLRI